MTGIDPSRREHAEHPPLAGTYRVLWWDPETYRRRVDELLAIYVAAMRYPAGTEVHRRALWLDNSYRTGFGCVVALDGADNPVGMAYGYRGTSDQWWYNEVGRGMTGVQRAQWLTDYVELTELHVTPYVQGGGLGEAMVRLLIGTASTDVVLLSTPEGENRAWRLYRRLGFEDVLRHYRFSGDPRPFAVLGRRLPLDPPAPPPPAAPPAPTNPSG